MTDASGAPEYHRKSSALVRALVSISSETPIRREKPSGEQPSVGPSGESTALTRGRFYADFQQIRSALPEMDISPLPAASAQRDTVMPRDCHPQRAFPSTRPLSPQDILGPVLADLSAPGRTRQAPELTRCLSRWTACLRSTRLESDSGPILAVWLPAEVEVEIEHSLREEPALGLLMHRLAARLVMAALAGLRPDLAERRCAPLPAVDPKLARTLALHDLATENGRLARRYAVLTFEHGAPLRANRDGCAGCSLRAGCPGPCSGDTP